MESRELFLLRLRYKEGRTLEVGGNKPFLLNESTGVWVVDSGQVNVFAVSIQNGQVVGSRNYLFCVESGQALFGIDPHDFEKGMGLLAVGAPGTRLLKVRKSQLQALAKNPSFWEEVIALIDGWITSLSVGVSREMPPKRSEPLEPEKEIVLEENDTVHAKKSILWIKNSGDGTSPARNLHFLGREELSVGEGFFPISRYTWLQSVSKNKLYAVETKTFIEQDPSWSGLEKFHERILAGVILNAEQEARAERERLKNKSASNRLFWENTFSRLASVLEPDASKKPFIRDDGGDPLLAACQTVGDALGITIKPHPYSKKGRTQKNPLGDIAKASRIRVRQVILKEDWWRKDQGPLLAYIEENKRPVALLPTSSRSYELVDPVARTRKHVTRKVAESLAPIAYTFYRPFLDRVLTAGDLLKFGVWGCQKDLIMVLLMGIAGGILGMITPMATGVLFDTIIPEAERGQLLQLTVALLVSALAAALFQITRSIAMLRVEGRMNASVQAAVWDRLLSLPVPFFRDYSAGDLSDRAMGINLIRRTLSGTTITSILGSIFSLFNFGLLFYYDVKLAFVATGLVLIAIIATTLAGYLQLRYQRTLSHLQGKISGMVLQFITGISKLRVAGAESHAFALWAKEFSTQKEVAFKVRTISNGFAVFNAAFPVLSSMAIFAMVVYNGQTSNALLSTGTFLAFNAAFGSFLSAALGMSSALISVLAVVPIYERAKPILGTLPEVDIARSDPGELSGEIEVSHVSFRYRSDGPTILNDVSLQVKPGEFIAIAGPSGSGKSTLFRLLLGFETPQSGSIYYDGKDLADLDLREVRRQIGVVLQNGRLLPGDIFTNIIGSAPLALEDAWEAARMAGLDEDIKQMPMGMHTVISEGASTLSGGQRQRLMIARAMVKKPRILFFDEATSALDNQTQAIVSESLEKLQASRIVIAHRLSTILNADRIYVMEAGRIVQSGTYNELMSQRGLFAELAKRQIA